MSYIGRSPGDANTVTRNLRIRRRDHGLCEHGLRYQQSIEWIAMDEAKLAGPLGVVLADLQER